ncbi:ribosome biogenesis protein NOP53 [Lampetra fluviatilis]
MAEQRGAQVAEARPKRKKINKNKKKNWVKYSDVTDVEEFLEDVRLQERTTGGLVKDQPDASIFFLDTKNKPKDQNSNKGRDRPLKIDLILQPSSGVDTPLNLSVQQVPGARRARRRVARCERYGPNSGADARAERLLLARARAARKRASAPPEPGKAERPFYDLWDTNGPLGKELQGQDDWFLEQTKRKRVKPHILMLEKPSRVPAVEAPLPGLSYNPAYEDHQMLLLDAHAVEVKKLREQRKLERQLRYPAGQERPTQASLFKEICEGLFEESEGEEEAEKADVEEGAKKVSVRAVSRLDKKTPQQRRREKAAKDQERRRKAEKVARVRGLEAQQLRRVRKEVHARQAELARRKLHRQEKRLRNINKPKRLGRLKYAEPDVDLKLSDELVGTLRELKPEGSLLMDRFKSFHKRNMLEPRERAKFKRKHKVKYQEKRAFREITL